MAGRVDAVGSKHGVDLLTRRLVDDGYPVVSGPRTTGDGYYESCILGPEGIHKYKGVGRERLFMNFVDKSVLPETKKIRTC